jgi:hypothetical protein
VVNKLACREIGFVGSAINKAVGRNAMQSDNRKCPTVCERMKRHKPCSKGEEQQMEINAATEEHEAVRSTR